MSSKFINIAIVGEPSPGKSRFLCHLSSLHTPSPAHKFIITSTLLVLSGHPTSFSSMNLSTTQPLPIIESLFCGMCLVGLVVYDLSSRASFDSVYRWRQFLRASCSEMTMLVVVGCSDNGCREVATEEGMKLAKGLKAVFVEMVDVTVIEVKTLFEIVGLTLLDEEKRLEPLPWF